MNLNDRKMAAEALTREAIRAREFGNNLQRMVLERIIVFGASLLGLSVLAVRIKDPDTVWVIFAAWGLLTGSITAGLAGLTGRWLFHTSQFERAIKMGIAVEKEITLTQLDEMKADHERGLDPLRRAVRVSLALSFALLLAGLAMLLTFVATNIPT